MNLRKRIERLEGIKGKNHDPFVMLIGAFKTKSDAGPTGANVDQRSPKHIAIIGAGPFGNAVQLSCHEDETEYEFRVRTRSEIMRIHGRLPKNWDN